MPPKEIFLSHSSHDIAIARSIATTLRNHGVPVWYSVTNIRSAQQWHDEIGKALRRCDWFLLLLTPNSIQSPWVKRELMYALIHGQYENHIIPLLETACNYESLSWTLEQSQMIIVNGDLRNAFIELLRTWGLGYDESLAS